MYPAHGAGSACGKNMSKETTDTLGNQKMFNYALRADMTREEFEKDVTSGLMPPPAYFPENVMMNIRGYESIDTVLERGTHAMDPEAFEAAANLTGAVVLDTRDAAIFAKGYIPNSINIGVNGSFGPWAGTLIPDIKQSILLITEPGKEEEVVIRLARVGYDYTIGYLKGGIDEWIKSDREIDQIESLSAAQMGQRLQNDPSISVLDVRKATEFDSEHVIGAQNLPLDYINDHLPELDKDKTYFVHCAGGYRSMIFNSILKARGYDNLIDIKGGFKAMKESGKFEVSNYVCPSTLL